MSRLPRLGAAALAVALCVVPLFLARADEAAVPPPYKSIRALRRLQEQVAHGSTAAHAAQPALLVSMATNFLDADPMVWRDARNARAAIIYLFSGGKPAVVRTILSRSTTPREIDRLLKGALAYAEGQDQIARDLLEPIDPRTVPAVVGGPLALVEATLFAGSDPKKAARFLDIARLLVPGSLVEEAALRRQITLETGPATLSKFVALSRQYLHRFQSSIYAQNFKQHLAAAAVRIGAQGDVALIGRLDPIMEELPKEEQRALFLGIARAAITQGHTEAARYSAERAATIATDSARDSVRAQLYLDAAAIVSDDVVKGIAALEAADGARLSPEDADLRDAALAVAHAVQAPVAVPTDGATAPLPVGDQDAALLVDQARRSLNDGTQLLQNAH